MIDNLYYDEETGKLFRVKELKCTGDDNTTNTIRFQGGMKQATHVIFFLMTGRWPEPGLMIDHKDGDPSNNRWSNLREATPKQNSQNRKSPGRWYNHDLPKGVYKIANRYKVVVDNINFGSFETLQEAIEVVTRERKNLQGEFARKDETNWRRF